MTYINGWVNKAVINNNKRYNRRNDEMPNGRMLGREIERMMKKIERWRRG